MADTYEPGEIVDIVIKGAIVVNTFGTGYTAFNGPHQDTGTVLVFHHPDNNPSRDKSHTVNMGAAGVTVERVAPAEWPPQVGDLWRDQYGDLWFANEGHGADGGTYVDLHCSISKVTDAWGSQIGFSVNREYGPLTLVHREEESRG